MDRVGNSDASMRPSIFVLQIQPSLIVCSLLCPVYALAGKCRSVIDIRTKRGKSFVEKNLFGPLAIEHYSWRHVPVGRTTGRGNLSITTRDEVRSANLVERRHCEWKSHSERRFDCNRAWSNKWPFLIEIRMRTSTVTCGIRRPNLSAFTM